MNYITIDEDYLNYMRNFEPRIPYQNYGEYKYKPFISPLFEVNDLVYVTHLTHYNAEKHSKIQINDLFKHIICDVGGKPVSVINIAGMFPVPKCAIRDLKYDDIKQIRKFNNEAEKYKFVKFLKIQMHNISRLGLENYAKCIYANQKVFNDYSFCVEFLKLESYALKWEQNKIENLYIHRNLSI